MRSQIVGLRILSGIIDTVVFALLWWPWYIATEIYFHNTDYFDGAPWFYWIDLLTRCAIPLLIFSLIAARFGYTPGQRCVGIQFDDGRGNKISYWHYVCRLILNIPILLPTLLPDSWKIAIGFLVIMSLITALLDPQHRMIPDILMDTTVQQKSAGSV
jgi:uncharacterized RDD family membrane protein YckC